MLVLAAIVAPPLALCSALRRRPLPAFALSAALGAAALLQSLPWLGQGEVAWTALLLTLTGGLSLAPICLVFWHYLTSTTRLPCR